MLCRNSIFQLQYIAQSFTFLQCLMVTYDWMSCQTQGTFGYRGDRLHTWQALTFTLSTPAGLNRMYFSTTLVKVLGTRARTRHRELKSAPERRGRMNEEDVSIKAKARCSYWWSNVIKNTSSVSTVSNVRKIHIGMMNCSHTLWNKTLNECSWTVKERFLHTHVHTHTHY